MVDLVRWEGHLMVSVDVWASVSVGGSLPPSPVLELGALRRVHAPAGSVAGLLGSPVSAARMASATGYVSSASGAADAAQRWSEELRAKREGVDPRRGACMDGTPFGMLAARLWGNGMVQGVPRHPHVLAPVRMGMVSERRCVLLEWTPMDVVDLRTARPGKGHARRCAFETVRALSRCHANGVVHGNLSPHAVRFVPGGSMRLAGWTPALTPIWPLSSLHAASIDVHPSSSSSSSSPLPSENALAQWSALAAVTAIARARTHLLHHSGLSSYSAPELLHPLPERDAEAPANPFAIDLWALGCAIVDILTGQPLFPTLPTSATADSSESNQAHITMPPSTESITDPLEYLAAAHSHLFRTLALSVHEHPFQHFLQHTIKLPPHAADLVASLLQRNPAHRIAAKNADRHPFFRLPLHEALNEPAHAVDEQQLWGEFPPPTLENIEIL